jgi:methyltransferase
MTTVGGLALFLFAIVLQRLGELVLSARNARRVAKRGAREYGARHFPFIVAVHALFPVCLAAEVLLLGARPGRWWPLWLGLWLLAQALRYAAVRALGDRWNVRILVLPGVAPVRSGIYGRLRHPNYLAIVIEFVAAPMVFGAWRTAVVISALNAVPLAVRIRAEDDALRRAASGSAGPARAPRWRVRASWSARRPGRRPSPRRGGSGSSRP